MKTNDTMMFLVLNANVWVLIELYIKNCFACFFYMRHLADVFFIKTGVYCKHYNRKIYFRLSTENDLNGIFCHKFYRKSLFRLLKYFPVLHKWKTMKLKFKRLSNCARAPAKVMIFSAGYDIFTAQKFKLKLSSLEIMKTDIQLKIPKTHYGRIAPPPSSALEAVL